MPSVDTTYNPNGINVNAQGGYGLDMTGLGNLQASMDAAMRFKQWQAMHGMQQHDEDRLFQRNQVLRANQMQDTDRERARSEQLRALMQGGGPQGDPYYVKPMTGFNMSGGYARASAGDPGAVFGGYMPKGALPQGAQFASLPRPSPAQLGPEAPTPQYNAPEDDLATRYFKQFGRLPGGGGYARPTQMERS